MTSMARQEEEHIQLLHMFCFFFPENRILSVKDLEY